ncbi:hypothetical protein [Ochrobactrum sp. Marseille-Q0166]|uniref:hypothetical protein n=1 Tax=Ochrobactrum sp. Marseille-Q0166 TaxID=2761105 RepID=UPI001655D97F|nr:hypothetical protein [Ochrobactrum sp. Marseille-Q0166]MBC8718826.1 hypothetical protein [Ochrobactrum sp. Marseille-Q0166]
MFDLSEIKINLDAMECEIRHPATGEVLKGKDGPFVILLHGQDSEIYKNHARKLLNARMNAGKKKMRVEDIEREALDQLVSLTVGWKNLYWAKKPLEYSADEARKLYSNGEYSWLREQVETFIADRSNFLPKSPES